MNIKHVIVMIFTIVFSIASMFMLRYEWKRQMKIQQEEPIQFPKGLWVYSGIMLAMQIVLAYLLTIIYPENTVCMLIKRLGLLALIWQAAAIDWKFQKIPNDIILVGVAFRIMMMIPEYLLEREMFIVNLVSEGIALVAMIILVVVCLLLMKDSIGMGDLKLLMLMAICQGLQGIMMSGFISMLVSFFVAVALLVSKRKTRKDAIPFAPCILPGTLLGVFLTGI